MDLFAFVFITHRVDLFDIIKLLSHISRNGHE